jgi:hypothetical protein
MIGENKIGNITVVIIRGVIMIREVIMIRGEENRINELNHYL